MKSILSLVHLVSRILIKLLGSQFVQKLSINCFYDISFKCKRIVNVISRKKMSLAYLWKHLRFFSLIHMTESILSRDSLLYCSTIVRSPEKIQFFCEIFETWADNWFVLILLLFNKNFFFQSHHVPGWLFEWDGCNNIFLLLFVSKTFCFIS